ncbi:nitronate monooxygenase [Actomonas aquatica]|uniref:Nitronate monooxygenase n=1 Tax=Actomonas aquatica TaxID=2866162 RepID=A0ABZ1C8C7_9BACT|nr:nitronate monooxygenase [Opitutus sp. WL0086]WRQ86565.1 nitronate monooxygenase [Opitutus sp. WL0086]
MVSTSFLSPSSAWPTLIQGGMGIGVSDWKLARAVSRCGQLGVVSGTALASVLVRRLQAGDLTGDIRRALAACPLRAEAETVLHRYWCPEGRPDATPYAAAPMPRHDAGRFWTGLTALAAFVEVFLAKEGHDGVVGLNLLEKIQLPSLPTLFGAMLAGVDYVLMGAGIPRAIPGVLDRFARGEPAMLELYVEDDNPDRNAPPVELRLDPSDWVPGLPPLHRPRFLAIVSSHVLATSLARKASGRVDGFVVEGWTAGGHNAPPRGAPTNATTSEAPVYGPRDEVDLAALRAIDRPFWLAGSFASADRLASARAAGAQGVQLGTAFAFCTESGVTAELKTQVIALSRSGQLRVETAARVSPTGLPFKVLNVPGTLADPEQIVQRPRRCDLGYLRVAYRRPDGSLGYRCPAEPVDDYIAKGGDPADTVGRLCLCNGLLGTIGLGQRQPEDFTEPALITAGVDATELARFIPPGEANYTAADVIRQLGLPA